jgi:hypothetical protein
MQVEVTFSENSIETKVEDIPKIFRTIKPIQGLRQFVEESDWDERLLGCEKCINRFFWTIIIAAVIYLTPVCINIFTR